ncbi:hypothetical protein D3C75_1156320 [compost metagenome]
MTNRIDTAKTAEIGSYDDQGVESDQPQRRPNLLLQADGVSRYLVFKQNIDKEHQNLQAKQPGDGVPA